MPLKNYTLTHTVYVCVQDCTHTYTVCVQDCTHTVILYTYCVCMCGIVCMIIHILYTYVYRIVHIRTRMCTGLLTSYTYCVCMCTELYTLYTYCPHVCVQDYTRIMYVCVQDCTHRTQTVYVCVQDYTHTVYVCVHDCTHTVCVWVQDRLSMLSDLCRDEFDFAWRRPMPQFSDSRDVRDILQQTCTVVTAVDVRHYNRDTLSAAVGAVIQTGGYAYGRCMKVLRNAVCGSKVCTCTQPFYCHFLGFHCHFLDLAELASGTQKTPGFQVTGAVFCTSVMTFLSSNQQFQSSKDKMVSMFLLPFSRFTAERIMKKLRTG